jgi:hypothetical protein
VLVRTCSARVPDGSQSHRATEQRSFSVRTWSVGGPHVLRACARQLDAETRRRREEIDLSSHVFRARRLVAKTQDAKKRRRERREEEKKIKFRFARVLDLRVFQISSRRREDAKQRSFRIARSISSLRLRVSASNLRRAHERNTCEPRSISSLRLRVSASNFRAPARNTCEPNFDLWSRWLCDRLGTRTERANRTETSASQPTDWSAFDISATSFRMNSSMFRRSAWSSHTGSARRQVSTARACRP